MEIHQCDTNLPQICSHLDLCAPKFYKEVAFVTNGHNRFTGHSCCLPATWSLLLCYHFSRHQEFSYLYLIYIYYKLLNVFKKFYYNNEKVTKMSAFFSNFFIRREVTQIW